MAMTWHLEPSAISLWDVHDDGDGGEKSDAMIN